jgi:hypothetical protein
MSIESESVAINLAVGGHIPERRVLLVGSGLQARVRVESSHGLGRPVDVARVEALPEEIGDYEVVILDLDEVGLPGVEALRDAGYRGRLVGFYSHVSEELGAAAGAAGVETYARGRFWRDIQSLLGTAGDQGSGSS